MNNNSFSLAFTSDVYRMRKLKSVWVSLIIMFLAIFLTFAVYWIGMKIIENTPPEQAPDADGTMQVFDLLIVNLLYGSSSIACIEFLIAIVACIFIGKDFSNGYVALTTARGAKRADTYFSKWLSMVCLFFFYMCFALVVSGIFYATLHFNSLPAWQACQFL